jgi:hypothetical protein
MSQKKSIFVPSKIVKKMTKNQELFDKIIIKSDLEHQVLNNSQSVFKKFKKILEQVRFEFQNYTQEKQNCINFELHETTDSSLELVFGGDILRFVIHSNVFLIPRYDTINNSPYIKEDAERGYCGVINIYNFLFDSFKYKRLDDIGYLIGRVFINKDNHYFVQGKRELSRYLNMFSDNAIETKDIEDIICSAMLYVNCFDLLIPPYDEVKEVTVSHFLNELDTMQLIPTGKRLGFRFAADNNTENS